MHSPSPRDVLESLLNASSAAEESYWELVPPVADRSRDASRLGVSAMVEAWSLAQDWSGAVSRIPDSAGCFDGIRVLIHAGFVGLVVDPPYAEQPALAILDPLQIRRLETAFWAAAHAAATHETSPAAAAADAAAGALQFLAEAPWPSDVAVPDPTPDAATAHLVHHRLDFLVRRAHSAPARSGSTGKAESSGSA
jgi:hypothetical protein